MNLSAKERDSKYKLAVNILKSQDLLTSREIRVMSNNGGFTQTEQIAHEYANGLACAVGWNDVDPPLDDTDISIAVQLAEQNMQPERLEKIRRGYLAVHYPKWVTAQFQKELDQARSSALHESVGVEITAVRDDRFLGEVLKTLLERLKGEVFNSDANLATAIREVLDTVSHGQTLFGRIKQGGLGTQAYRRARFLKVAGDAYIINWARTFIKEFYPATLSKRKDVYSLVHDKRIELVLSSIKCWLSKREDGEISELETLEQIQPQAELKEQVRERREAEALLETIADEFDLAIGTVSDWCKDIKVEKNTVRGKREKRRSEKAGLKQQAIEMEKSGMERTEIAAQLNENYRNICRWLKK